MFLHLLQFTYVQDLHRRLWNKLTSSCHYLDLVQIVLMNATREEYNVLAWQPLVASPNSPIGTLLLSSAATLLNIQTNHTLCGLRYNKYTTTTATTITTEHVVDNDELETLCTALHIVSHSWPALDTHNQEWQHGILQMLLDVLEFVILPNVEKYKDLACSILQVLQTACQSRPASVEYLQTLIGVHENWATSGMSVLVRLAHASCTYCPPQVQMESVRVLHQVLWHVRRQQEEDVSTANSFQSLLVEHAELHKSTCTDIVLNTQQCMFQITPNHGGHAIARSVLG